LEFFASQGIKATYFVIARDLANTRRRTAIAEAVKQGHHLACHGFDHLRLAGASPAVLRREIVEAKAEIENALGEPCHGFRAPGFSLGRQALSYLIEAGYLYDASLFPSQRTQKRLGLDSISREPFFLNEDAGLYEVPMPYVGFLFLPFHPCYAFYLSSAYFRLCLQIYRRQANCLTLLFHLTDFSSTLQMKQSIKMNVFTNNFFPLRTKYIF
jgi:peptidoglycan/xylan/chitin deacetylase (PgdA/CDA1 family)